MYIYIYVHIQFQTLTYVPPQNEWSSDHENNFVQQNLGLVNWNYGWEHLVTVYTCRIHIYATIFSQSAPKQ